VLRHRKVTCGADPTSESGVWQRSTTEKVGSGCPLTLVPILAHPHRQVHHNIHLHCQFQPWAMTRAVLRINHALDESWFESTSTWTCFSWDLHQDFKLCAVAGPKMPAIQLARDMPRNRHNPHQIHPTLRPTHRCVN